MVARFRHLLAALMLGAFLGGCNNLGYYAQAVGGHVAVMRAARPINEIVSDPASAPALRKSLAEVQAIRDFASRELGLPDNDSYRSYADLGRPFVVWNVFAAPEFSLKPREWCLLLVGCVSYLGYYDKRDAEGFAAELRAAGYDTFVGGVPAYSTLGYFADPVLNTFLRRGTPEVARTVFHEMAHQLIYVPGDSLFNESFATAVENEGMRRWLASHASPEMRASYLAQQARKTAFIGLIRGMRQRFQALYASPRPAEQMRSAKAGLFAQLRSDYAALKAGWGGYAGYDKYIAEDLNNAKLVSFSLYTGLLPAFEHLLDQEDHELPRFYRRVKALAALDKDARCAALTQPLVATGEASPLCRPATAGALGANSGRFEALAGGDRN